MKLHLGVTGHRALENQDEIRRRINLAIDQALEASWDGVAPSPIEIVAVSALAEGADRLVVHECLRRDRASLAAVLPLPSADYSKDFLTPASRREFAELLAAATSVTVAEEMPTRAEAYARAGQLMVERSDVVIAVWDGLPARGKGGTADIVAYARARQVPLLAIHA